MKGETNVLYSGREYYLTAEFDYSTPAQSAHPCPVRRELNIALVLPCFWKVNL